MKITNIPHSIGNHKLGKDTIIFNMTSATDCPSHKLGLCKIGKTRCYAMKAERCYPQVLPFRRRQERTWDSIKPSEFVSRIAYIKSHNSSLKYLRFSESGDFKSQSDVRKMSSIAKGLSSLGIRVYGYTARKDLDYSKVHSNMVVNGSGFQVHNEFTATDSLGPRFDHVCGGDCRKCNWCKGRHGHTIAVKFH